MKKVAVFGLGYVGCVTSACLARDGHQVIGVDVDPNKVAELNAGVVPIVEPGLGEIVAEQVKANRLTATSDLELAVRSSDLALVCVGTPSSEDGSVSSAAVERVVGSIGRAFRGSNRAYTVVIRSTLLPGILEERLSAMLANESGRPVGCGLTLCNNPEFLRETHAIFDYDNPPFLIVGAASPVDAQPVLELYECIPGERFITDPRTSALVKYACNAFHAVKVAFANEIGSLAKAMGANGQDVMRMFCRDTKLNISPVYMKPGFAFGGSCLPKDVRAITRFAEREGLSLDLLKAVLPSNETHIRRGIRQIERRGHKRVGLIGLSFKAGTDDLRESPLVILVEVLLGRGFDIRIYDPYVSVSRLRGRNLAYIDLHLPHLAKLLVASPQDIYSHSSVLILGTDVANTLGWESAYTGETVDLRSDIVSNSRRSSISPAESCLD